VQIYFIRLFCWTGWGDQLLSLFVCYVLLWRLSDSFLLWCDDFFAYFSCVIFSWFSVKTKLIWVQAVSLWVILVTSVVWFHCSHKASLLFDLLEFCIYYVFDFETVIIAALCHDTHAICFVERPISEVTSKVSSTTLNCLARVYHVVSVCSCIISVVAIIKSWLCAWIRCNI